MSPAYAVVPDNEDIFTSSFGSSSFIGVSSFLSSSSLEGVCWGFSWGFVSSTGLFSSSLLLSSTGFWVSSLLFGFS